MRIGLNGSVIAFSRKQSHTLVRVRRRAIPKLVRNLDEWENGT